MKHRWLLVFIFSFIFSVVWIWYLLTKNDKIILGQTCALSGPAGVLGKDSRDGALAYFDYVNRQGGIKGRKIELITMDDRYEPDIAEKNSEKLVGDGIFAFFGVVGTPTALSSLGVAMSNDKLFIAPITGATFLRNNMPNVINMRASYETEARALIDYLVSIKHHKNIAILYQNDAFGADGSWGVKMALKKHMLKECASYAFNRNTLSFKYALDDMTKKKPDAIIMVGTYQPCAEFIKLAKRSGLDDTIFCAMSFVHSKELKKSLGSSVANVVVSEVVPDYMDDRFASAILYRKLFRQYMPDGELSCIGFEGFLSAMYVSKALNNSSMVLSNQAVKAAFDTIETIGGIGVGSTILDASSHGVYLDFLDKQ